MFSAAPMWVRACKTPPSSEAFQVQLKVLLSDFSNTQLMDIFRVEVVSESPDMLSRGNVGTASGCSSVVHGQHQTLVIRNVCSRACPSLLLGRLLQPLQLSGLLRIPTC